MMRTLELWPDIMGDANSASRSTVLMLNTCRSTTESLFSTALYQGGYLRNTNTSIMLRPNLPTPAQRMWLVMWLPSIIPPMTNADHNPNQTSFLKQGCQEARD